MPWRLGGQVVVGGCQKRAYSVIKQTQFFVLLTCCVTLSKWLHLSEANRLIQRRQYCPNQSAN